ncbi:MAG TPA: hypothetical protein VIY47_14365, partial [Ignavibacteriaceae bacterium]
MKQENPGTIIVSSPSRIVEIFNEYLSEFKELLSFAHSLKMTYDNFGHFEDLSIHSDENGDDVPLAKFRDNDLGGLEIYEKNGIRILNPKEKIEEMYGEDSGILFADGYDSAIVGVSSQAGGAPVVVYDSEKVIEILMERDGMDREDAEEFFSFNVESA